MKKPKPLPAGLVELPPATSSSRRFRVELPHQPGWEGAAAGPEAAIAAMKAAYGILATDHTFSVTPLE